MKPSERRADSASPAGPQLKGCRVHFVGIGGCGMSGLARLVRQAGAVCTGSDLAESETVESLRNDGFAVVLDQSATTVPGDCQMVVISAAVRQDHPEVAEARRRGLVVYKYAQMLGGLMRRRTGVAIAGTHGKSTATSMLCHVLIQGGADPSFIVGATCRQIGGGVRCGRPDLLIAEACEFDRSFHNFFPMHGVILNVEEDHLDIYGSIDAVVEAFAQFAKQVDPAGSLLINHEMAHRLTIAAGLDCAIETIGFAPQADWRVQLVDGAGAVAAAKKFKTPDELLGSGASRPWVQLHRKGKATAQWPGPLPGEHMAYNSAVAAVTAHRLGLDWAVISAELGSFEGLDRRMQYLGQRSVPRVGVLPTGGVEPPGQVTVVDDYGHHPTEIDTTLRALRAHYRPRRLICVFQPHQHSRTRFLMEQFASSFSEADVVIVPHIYFVRDSENERQAVSAGDLVDRLRSRGKQAMHLYPFGAIVEQLNVLAQAGDLLVTMGAGDVWKIARAFLRSEGIGGSGAGAGA